MSVDMGAFVAPKSDQLNADDLIAGPRTITITGVRGESSPEQPISISFQGDGDKPYKPCKSMRRVMLFAWGANADAYVGRSMTLYRDESVQFGGAKVGGIRISHMSHLETPMTMALTATRAKRAPYTVQPLPRETAAARKPSADAATVVAPTAAEYEACADRAAFDALERRRADAWAGLSAAQKKALKAASDAAAARLAAQASSASAPKPTQTETASPTEADLRAAKNQADLDKLWDAVQAAHAGGEIPLAIEAAYDEKTDYFRSQETG